MVKPTVKLNERGKIILLPMEHKKRIQLINFINLVYLNKPFIGKKLGREVMDECYMIVITDLSKNDLYKHINFI